MRRQHRATLCSVRGKMQRVAAASASDNAGARSASPRILAKILVGCGGHLHGLVEAATVDVRNFGSHRPKIGSKLSAMMDGMIRDKREVCSRRQFERPECRDDLGKLV